MRRVLIPLCAAIVLLAVLAAPCGAAAASKWTETQLPPRTGSDEYGPPLNGVSCPTESLCVAVGGLNTVAFSRAPTGGVARWHVVGPTYDEPKQSCLEDGESVAFCSSPRGSLNDVSCAGEHLCVAVGYEGSVYVSTDPTGGAGAWSVGDVNESGGRGATHLTSVTCPSPSFCAAVSGGFKAPGRVLTSTDPLAGRWQAAELGAELDLRGISCGTPSLCVAAAGDGRLFVSTNPTGGAAAWTELGRPGGPGDLEGVDCVAAALCAVGNLTGNVLTSTDPAGGVGTWRETDAGGSVQITDVSCPVLPRCAAVDNNGDILTSTDPTGGGGSWRFENLVPFKPTELQGQPPRNALFGASCPTAGLCVLVGIDGRVFTSTDPFSEPSTEPGRNRGGKVRRRPRTIVVFAENFWRVAVSRRQRVRARFRFYSPTRAIGFECKRDGGAYRRCRSPLRYWAGRGRHTLRVRAIGPTGLRGPAATKRFRVRPPRGHVATASGKGLRTRAGR